MFVIWFLVTLIRSVYVGTYALAPTFKLVMTVEADPFDNSAGEIARGDVMCVTSEKTHRRAPIPI